MSTELGSFIYLHARAAAVSERTKSSAGYLREATRPCPPQRHRVLPPTPPNWGGKVFSFLACSLALMLLYLSAEPLGSLRGSKPIVTENHIFGFPVRVKNQGFQAPSENQGVQSPFS